MKKQLFLMMGALLLSACANTVQGALQDTSNNLYHATEYVKQNPEVFNDAAEKTGNALKRGGELIGKGMRATGEYLQDMAR